MNHYLHFKLSNDVLLFKWIKLNNFCGLFFACLSAFLLPIILQALNSSYKRYRRQKSEGLSLELIIINNKRMNDTILNNRDDTLSVESIVGPSDLKKLDNSDAVPLKTRLTLTLFYTIGVTINYLLMCVVMTMNVILLFSLLLGFGLGYYIFNYD